MSKPTYRSQLPSRWNQLAHIFEGELAGILLALQLLDNLPRSNTALIALDNQSAITSLQKNVQQPGQYLLDAIHEKIAQLRRSCRIKYLHFEWVPGHVGIEGNEVADKCAKEAATGTVSVSDQIPPVQRNILPKSIAALKAERKKTQTSRWFTLWCTSPRYERISRIDKSLPCAKSARILLNLPRRATSILTQLRTGHVGLNAFLKKIKAVDSALCPKCKQPETVGHYLLFCQRYARQRRILAREAGKAANSISRLLSEPKALKATLHYIVATRRFRDYTTLDNSSLDAH